ncbi:MAG: glycosyltransferase family 39 protein [Chloroflexi bacterium]|nr:glycosyltransferase family 39 protein [Chloroflexota bacterium]
MSRRITTAPRRGQWFALAAVLLLAFALRVGALVSEAPLHPDEALFATFARHAALNGDWLLHGELDKPPLAIYAIALSMRTVAAQPRDTVLDFTASQGEAAARLPGLFASLITAASLFAVGRRLYRNSNRAFWAAMLFALSPIAIGYGTSAFTDGMMLCAASLALLAATMGRWTWSGIWFGAAFAAKQQALFLAPLVVGLGWATGLLTLRGFLRFGAASAAGLLLLMGWDALRGQTTGMLALAAANNDVSRLIRSGEVLPRLARWLTFGLSLHGLGIAALLPLSVAAGRSLEEHHRLIDRLLLLFIVVYAAAHWLAAFNTYERYALPLLLPSCLILSRGPARLSLRIRASTVSLRVHTTIALGAVTAFIVCGSLEAASGGRSLFSSDGRTGTAGIEEAATYLNEKPVATVIYDRWFGWELGFYLGEWTDKRRVYYPTPDTLARGAAALIEVAPRYFLAPAQTPMTLWLEALEVEGFSVVEEARFDQIVIYRLEPPGQ